ncbi:hypothetical protein V8E36_000961 [Tilletia maclaganii]
MAHAFLLAILRLLFVRVVVVASSDRPPCFSCFLGCAAVWGGGGRRPCPSSHRSLDPIAPALKLNGALSSVTEPSHLECLALDMRVKSASTEECAKGHVQDFGQLIAQRLARRMIALSSPCLHAQLTLPSIELLRPKRRDTQEAAQPRRDRHSARRFDHEHGARRTNTQAQRAETHSPCAGTAGVSSAFALIQLQIRPLCILPCRRGASRGAWRSGRSAARRTLTQDGHHDAGSRADVQ